MMAVITLFVLTLLTWAIAIWATFEEESPKTEEEHREKDPTDRDWPNAV